MTPEKAGVIKQKRPNSGGWEEGNPTGGQHWRALVFYLFNIIKERSVSVKGKERIFFLLVETLKKEN